MKPGIGKLVYGLEKVNSSTVKLENGHLIRKPSFPFSECRACALLNVVCEELENPCTRLLRECKSEEKGNCGECERLEECLGEKPCCWDCPCLAECLEMARDWGAGCEWEEFIAAVKMLVVENGRR